MSEGKRKTRLKGTENQKPCFECGKTKDRFKDFKPRWAGCITHRTERGRRYHQAGCAECEKIVNGNIRQPRCIECDKGRPKKAADAPTTTEGEAAPPLNLPESVTEGKSAVAVQAAVEVGAPVVDVAVEPAKPEDVLGLPTKAEPEPAPVVVATPEPEAAPAPEALPVVVAPPAPVAKPAPTKKKVASKADLFALFATDEAPKEEGSGPF